MLKWPAAEGEVRSEFSEELILVSGEKLSVDELETLKETTNLPIDGGIRRIKSERRRREYDCKDCVQRL